MDNCIFCEIGKGNIKSWKIYEDDNTFAFLDINPSAKYHALVIPKNHFKDIFDISVDELKNVAAAIKNVCSLYSEKLGIENLQVLCSSGKEAQQEVPHIHFHIVPRSTGDGLDIHWEKHPEWTQDFEKMIEKIK